MSPPTLRSLPGLGERRLKCRTCAPAGGRCRLGAEVCTSVHRVLEATDFAAVTWAAELNRTGGPRERARRGVEIGDPAAVVDGPSGRGQRLPLGPVLGGRQPCQHRPGGPSGRARLRAAAGRRRHPDRDDRPEPHRRRAARAPAGRVDPMAAYAERLKRRGAARRRPRLPDRESGPRGPRARSGTGSATPCWTTRPTGSGTWTSRSTLGPLPARPDPGRDAPPPLLAAGPAVSGCPVPLPALARPGYDPDLHLAGAVYLFVRGCTVTPHPRPVTAPTACSAGARRPACARAVRRAGPRRRVTSAPSPPRPIASRPDAVPASGRLRPFNRRASSPPPTCMWLAGSASLAVRRA